MSFIVEFFIFKLELNINLLYLCNSEGFVSYFLEKLNAMLSSDAHIINCIHECNIGTYAYIHNNTHTNLQSVLAYRSYSAQHIHLKIYIKYKSHNI